MNENTNDETKNFDDLSGEDGGDNSRPVDFSKVFVEDGVEQKHQVQIHAGHTQAMADKVLRLLLGTGLFLIALIWSLNYFGQLSLIEGLFGSVTTLIGTIAGYMLRSLKAP